MVTPHKSDQPTLSGPVDNSGGALSLTAEPSVLPPEIALAYAKVLKEPPAPAYVLPDQRWGAWGGGFGGSNRTKGGPWGVGSHDVIARTGGYAA